MWAASCRAARALQGGRGEPLTKIWDEPAELRDAVPRPAISEDDRRALSLPALRRLDDVLARTPEATAKVLAFVPVHVAAQGRPGTRSAAIEAECKRRISTIARQHGALVIDWRIASPITTNDANYWDALHYREAVGAQISHELVTAVIDRANSPVDSYRFLIR
jgi:hypothetical protein